MTGIDIGGFREGLLEPITVRFVRGGGGMDDETRQFPHIPPYAVQQWIAPRIAEMPV